MDRELTNTASANGTYNGVATALNSEPIVVAMVSGLTITKVADKTSWADGALTYTITVDNQATENYESPVITDVIDTTLVDFVADSVLINDVAATAEQYTYNAETGTLTVNLSNITPTNSSTVKFQVTKKA